MVNKCGSINEQKFLIKQGKNKEKRDNIGMKCESKKNNVTGQNGRRCAKIVLKF